MGYRPSRPYVSGTAGQPFWTGRRLFPCLGAQAHWLDSRFSGALLAIQVGRFFEFYGPRAEDVSRVARLKLIRGRRAGYWGWTRLPVDRLPHLLQAARRAGVPRIVLVREGEAHAGGVIPRIPAAAGAIRQGPGLLQAEEPERV